MEYKKLNPLLHAPLRLSIISFLISNNSADFNEIKSATGATGGNLSVQLKKLEAAKYISIVKGFKNNYQHTHVEITPTGIDAFEAYVNAIKKYIEK